MAEATARDVIVIKAARRRDHGVDPDYVADLARLGYRGISAEEIVRLRIHGVDADFIRRANSGDRLTPEQLVRLRIGGRARVRQGSMSLRAPEGARQSRCG